MIITFNRESGNILSLGETFKNFNNKTITVDELTHMKYISIEKVDKVPKIDKFGRPCNMFKGDIFSALTKVTDNTERGQTILKEGNIELFDSSVEVDAVLEGVEVYDEVGRYYSFPKDYKVFNIDEIMAVFYQNKLEASESQYALADNFSYLKNILIHSSTFKSINKREIILSPGDILKLKSETLTIPANVFNILESNKHVTVYINDLELDTMLEFKKPINKINISFKNNTKSDIILDSILIGYSNVTN